MSWKGLQPTWSPADCSSSRRRSAVVNIAGSGLYRPTDCAVTTRLGDQPMRRQVPAKRSSSTLETTATAHLLPRERNAGTESENGGQRGNESTMVLRSLSEGENPSSAPNPSTTS